MDIKVIENREEFENFMLLFKEVKSLAIDLEFDKNRNRYGFNICLIQIALESGACFILDPLNQAYNYKEIFPILENPRIEKLTYAFGEDYRLLLTLGCRCKGVYDLNFAVILLNNSHTGLTHILREVVSIESKPSAQMSNWFNRPLTEKQIIYAAEDVTYLYQLKSALMKQLKDKGIEEWVQEENYYLNQLEFEESEEDLFKEKYKHGLNEVQWHVLKGILSLREEQAKKLKRPSYQVIPTPLILEWVSDPKLMESFTVAKGIHRSIKNLTFQNHLLKLHKNLEQEALKMELSPDRSAKKKLDRESWKKMQEEKKLVEDEKKRLFKPIQEEIAKDYGEYAAPYILSNRLMKELILKRRDQIKKYKKELISKYAEKIGMDVSAYLEEVGVTS